MTKCNIKTKIKVKSSYTYLTSVNIKRFINQFRYEGAEQEILKDLAVIVNKFGKITSLESLSKKSDEIKIIFNKSFPKPDNNLSDFEMKSQLKRLFKEEHMNRLEISKFWSNLVFGFNSIIKKLEKGINIDLILIDKCLEDAPILGHLRNLAINQQNSDLIISVFDHNELAQVLSCDTRKFNKLLMIGILKEIDGEQIINFKKSVLSKVQPVQLPESQLPTPLQPHAQPKIEINRKSPQKRKTATDQSPYIVSSGEVNFLISKHLNLTKSEENVPKIKDIDFLVDLKRVKVDETQTTKLIRPPDQQKKKKNKKLKRKITKQ